MILEEDKHLMQGIVVKENSLYIIALGDPTAQKRHRHVNMGLAGVRNYDPSTTDKADFLAAIRHKAPIEPFLGPLQVDCYFFFKRPNSHFGTGKKAGVLKDNAPDWKISKPDRDNLDKLVMDSMKDIFWKDDAQACAGSIYKRYSLNPRTVIVVTPLT